MERREVESAEAARQWSARLIVVGTYGKGSFRSAIPSSAPHKPLHISEVPVLCVPARGRAS
jgi:nucleotide-binding universal stress UspA family protein